MKERKVITFLKALVFLIDDDDECIAIKNFLIAYGHPHNIVITMYKTRASDNSFTVNGNISKRGVSSCAWFKFNDIITQEDFDSNDINLIVDPQFETIEKYRAWCGDFLNMKLLYDEEGDSVIY